MITCNTILLIDGIIQKRLSVSFYKGQLKGLLQMQILILCVPKLLTVRYIFH